MSLIQPTYKFGPNLNQDQRAWLGFYSHSKRPNARFTNRELFVADLRSQTTIRVEVVDHVFCNSGIVIPVPLSSEGKVVACRTLLQSDSSTVELEDAYPMHSDIRRACELEILPDGRIVFERRASFTGEDRNGTSQVTLVFSPSFELLNARVFACEGWGEDHLQGVLYPDHMAFGSAFQYEYKHGDVHTNDKYGKGQGVIDAIRSLRKAFLGLSGYPPTEPPSKAFKVVVPSSVEAQVA